MSREQNFSGKFTDSFDRNKSEKDLKKLTPEEESTIEKALSITKNINEFTQDDILLKKHLDAVQQILSFGNKILPFLKVKMVAQGG